MKLALGVIFLIIAGAFTVYMIWSRQVQQSPPLVTSAPGPDQEVLDQLRKVGSDVTKPHQFDFYVYFPTQETAEKAEIEIRRMGLTTKVEPAASGPQWLCLASRTFVPAKPEIHAIQQHLSDIATVYGGDYDGWEAEVKQKGK